MKIQTNKQQSLQTEVLKELILSNNAELFPVERFKGRGKGAYTQNISDYSLLIARCLCGLQHHNYNPSAYDLGGKVGLSELFKSDKVFHAMNNKCQVFISTGDYKPGLSNMAYTINPIFLSNVNALVEAHTSATVTEWPTYKPEHHDDYSVCTTSYHGLTTLLVDETTTAKERLYCWSLRESYSIHNNTIPQFYVKGKKTDRLFGKGPLAIGNIPNRVREHVLADYNEYDLSSACFTILLNLTGNKGNFPTIKNYVSDVRLFRILVAKQADVTVSDVKTVFLHKSFGSALTFKTGIAKELSMTIVDSIRITPLFARFNDELKALKEELYLLHPEKLEHFKQSRDVYEDGHKNEGQFKGGYRATYICWLYQSFEIKIIQLIRNELANKDDCLLLHDAIYTKEILDKKTLERLVEMELQLKVKIG
nr:hypothetical protein [Moritella viscosa]SHO17737.1 Putative uncharacterized protein [Moritella viscosa]